jgi:hypothetical protein
MSSSFLDKGMLGWGSSKLFKVWVGAGTGLGSKTQKLKNKNIIVKFCSLYAITYIRG